MEPDPTDYDRHDNRVTLAINAFIVLCTMGLCVAIVLAGRSPWWFLLAALVGKLFMHSTDRNARWRKREMM